MAAIVYGMGMPPLSSWKMQTGIRSIMVTSRLFQTAHTPSLMTSMTLTGTHGRAAASQTFVPNRLQPSAFLVQTFLFPQAAANARIRNHAATSIMVYGRCHSAMSRLLCSAGPLSQHILRLHRLGHKNLDSHPTLIARYSCVSLASHRTMS